MEEDIERIKNEIKDLRKDFDNFKNLLYSVMVGLLAYSVLELIE